MAKPKYRIIKHTNGSGDVYYTLQYRGLFWGWNTVKERVCDYYGEATDIKRFATLESAQYYLDSLKPEITEVVKEIY